MSETELPAGWIWARLGDLGDEVRESVRPKPGHKYELWSVPSFATGRPECLDGGEIGSAKLATRPDDVLICKINPRINRVWLTTENARKCEQIASPEWVIVRTPETVQGTLGSYLRYYLSSPAFRRWIKGAVSGVTGSHTRAKSKEILDQRIPLPPLAEQQRIIEALEAHLSRLDAAVASLAHAQSLAPLQVRSLNTMASTGSLFNSPGSDSFDFDAARREAWRSQNGKKKYKEPSDPDSSLPLEIPQNWTICSLEAATDPVRIIRYGILMPKVDVGGRVPYVEVKDLSGCTLKGKTLHLTSTELDEQFAGARIKGGDVVLAVRGSYDRSAIVPDSIEKANLSRDVARLAPLPGLLPEFLQIFLQGGFAQRYLKKHARGVAVKGVNIAAIRSMPVAIPPLAVQKEIISLVEAQEVDLVKARETMKMAYLRAKALRKVLLRTAFTGALVPQDPADEPASALLAHIQAERAAQPILKRSRRVPPSRRAAAKTAAPNAFVHQELAP